MLQFPGRQDISICPDKTAFLVVDMNHWCSHPEIGAGKILASIPQIEFHAYYERIQKIVIPNIQNLLNLCHSKAIQVFYSIVGTYHADLRDWSPGLKISALGNAISSSRPGTPDYEIPKEIEPTNVDIVMHKSGSSFFTSTDLDHRLRRMHLDTLLVAGVLTNCCVYNTAISAAELGYKVVVVEDGCAALTQAEHQLFLSSTIASIFFHVASTAEVVDEFDLPDFSMDLARR